ncbi:CPBP family intramembrane metalloprotease [Bacillus sp. NP157]|nr:CPBP family intramembrane metalloprotease [Bacillus sp. NP157]
MAHDPALSSIPDEPLPAEPSSRSGPGWFETILIVIAYFALQLVLGGAFGLISRTIAGLIPDYAPGPDDRLVVVVILTLLASSAITLKLVVRRWGPLVRDGGPAGIGFTAPLGSQMLFGAVLGIVAPIAGGLLTQWLAGDHPLTQSVSTLADHAHIALRMALLPIVVLVGPLVEEVLFRGALLALLRTRLGDNWGIALSAIVFGLIHLPDLAGLWYAIPNLILVGAFCAWLRVRAQSIWPAYVCHAANNSLATLAWFN